MMRALIAKELVKLVSRWLDAAYMANQDGLPRLENFFIKGYRIIEDFAFPLARRLDEKAMGEQMAEESWWG